MTTECWYRNPHNYIRELVEVGGPYRIVWDRGILVKKHIDAHKHAKMYFGENTDWRILLAGQQGTAELDPDHDITNPKAVYPTWAYGEDLDILEEMMSVNIAEDPNAVTADVPVDQRPVPNQEHRVVVTNLPNVGQNSNRAFLRELKTLQEEYSDCILHVHGSYSFRFMFGQGWGAADAESRTDAANGRVTLPNGRSVPFAHTVATPQWVNLLGVSVAELKEPRNRCIFNIKSAKWAGEHWDEDIKFKTRGLANVDHNARTTMIPTTASSRSKSAMTPAQGDMITCDTCSLIDTCKFYRVGAVCSLPQSDTKSLADYFQSRDSSKIIDALGTVLGASTRRLERGLKDEEDLELGLDPEVTKLTNQVFNNGLKLAKIIDPSLTKPGVQINVGGGAAAVAAGTPNQLMGAVVRALENQGIARENITPEMVTETLKEMGMQEETPQLIEGTVE